MFNRNNQQEKNNKKIAYIEANYVRSDKLIQSLVNTLKAANDSINSDENNAINAIIDHNLKLERQKLFATNIALAESCIKSFNQPHKITHEHVINDINFLISANKLIAFKNSENFEEYEKCSKIISNRENSLENALDDRIRTDGHRYMKIRMGVGIALGIVMLAAFCFLLAGPAFIGAPIPLLVTACVLAVAAILFAINHGIDKGMIFSSPATNKLKDQTKMNIKLGLFDQEVRKHYPQENTSVALKA